MDMGLGVGGVCVPKVTPLSPLPLLEVEQILLPPECVLEEVGVGRPPPCVPKFASNSPIRGIFCVICGPNFVRGYPLGGKACEWVGILGDSRHLGARPVGE